MFQTPETGPPGITVSLCNSNKTVEQRTTQSTKRTNPCIVLYMIISSNLLLIRDKKCASDSENQLLKSKILDLSRSHVQDTPEQRMRPNYQTLDAIAEHQAFHFNFAAFCRIIIIKHLFISKHNSIATNLRKPIRTIQKHQRIQKTILKIVADRNFLCELNHKMQRAYQTDHR